MSEWMKQLEEIKDEINDFKDEVKKEHPKKEVEKLREEFAAFKQEILALINMQPKIQTKPVLDFEGLWKLIMDRNSIEKSDAFYNWLSFSKKDGICHRRGILDFILTILAKYSA